MQGLALEESSAKESYMHAVQSVGVHAQQGGYAKQAHTPVSMQDEAGQAELEAVRLWDRGQQCEAEELLKRAAYGIGLPEQMKVRGLY